MIEEFYTNTAGYTDQVFWFDAPVGLSFCSTAAWSADSKLYTIGKGNDLQKLDNQLRGQINTKIIKENYDDVLRLAHSIRNRTVSALLIMRNLGSFARQNRLATALRKMGRFERTIFVLDYISSEALHRGLITHTRVPPPKRRQTHDSERAGFSFVKEYRLSVLHTKWP